MAYIFIFSSTALKVEHVSFSLLNVLMNKHFEITSSFLLLMHILSHSLYNSEKSSRNVSSHIIFVE